MTFEHIISSKRLGGDFLRHLAEEGVGGVEPLAKGGTTSLVFTGVLGGRKVVIKLQRPDSPRSNFEKEAELTKIASTFGGVTPSNRWPWRVRGPSLPHQGVRRG
ncbi:hypothetical protein [Thermococcus sp. JCM 11816]|uniref:hypothetical protein n=1 Tax=Thermococcus sp. (strain JCM 11816 / KS-1) TaxID=1295125 RepID=UPI000A5E81CF